MQDKKLAFDLRWHIIADKPGKTGWNRRMTALLNVLPIHLYNTFIIMVMALQNTFPGSMFGGVRENKNGLVAIASYGCLFAKVESVYEPLKQWEVFVTF